MEGVVVKAFYQLSEPSAEAFIMGGGRFRQGKHLLVIRAAGGFA